MWIFFLLQPTNQPIFAPSTHSSLEIFNFLKKIKSNQIKRRKNITHSLKRWFIQFNKKYTVKYGKNGRRKTVARYNFNISFQFFIFPIMR